LDDQAASARVFRLERRRWLCVNPFQGDLTVFLKGPFNPSAYSARLRPANNSSSTIRQDGQAIDRKVGALDLAHE
jgi:hypothetical protein